MVGPSPSAGYGHSVQKPVADLHSKILDARHPPGGPNSFNFMQFWKNLAKSYVGAPPRVGAPSSGKSWIRHWKHSPFIHAHVN